VAPVHKLAGLGMVGPDGCRADITLCCVQSQELGNSLGYFDRTTCNA
jgi:hypothetical protein